MPSALRLEYDQRLHYVTVTFTPIQETKARVDAALRAGAEPPLDRTGWLYTFVPHYNVCNEGFVLGRMDNDTSAFAAVISGVGG